MGLSNTCLCIHTFVLPSPQPSSVCSLGSSSNTSSARSRSHSRTRYRTKAASSEVDESLFGLSKLSRPGSPVVILHDAGSARGKTLGWGRKPETIRLITRDLIRDLVVPTVDPSGESLIISPEDFQRIKESSRILTKEEQEAQQAVTRAEREATIVAVNERKKSMKMKEILRKKNEKLNDLEEEAKKRAQYLLDRANNLRMEQEDEIKTLAECHFAKCHAIRDAQVLEKKQIEKEMSGEEMRVDHLMEVERQKANQMQDEVERKRKEELYRGRRHLIEQIEKNEEMRAMKAEQRDQEAQDMLEYLERLQFEDEREMERRRLERLRIQAEIRNINDENQRRKMEKLNQERMADMRVLEYQRQKMAREAEFEAEQEKTRKEKEMETARLRALQEKAQDHQAEQVSQSGIRDFPTDCPRLTTQRGQGWASKKF
uniref:Cilia- and flagella-associated protein 45 n=1 Tax=Naja naja TaxID=35670 RepID=A0A8C6X909_NAJNA